MKKGKRYRYYVPYLEKRHSVGATYDPTLPKIGSLPALEIKTALLATVHNALREPEMMCYLRLLVAHCGIELQTQEL
jgi:hypothetical protein